jgi:hypothetical protein
LNSYSFIRTIIPGEQPNKTNKQIHVFADASKDAYAAVAYTKCKSNGKVRACHDWLHIEARGAIHQLLSIILKLRILVLLPVSTMPYVVMVKNYS